MSSVPLGGLGRFLSHFGNLTHSKDLSKPYSLFDLEAKTKGKNVCFFFNQQICLCEEIKDQD